MKYKIYYNHNHEGASRIAEFEVESEADLVSSENESIVQQLSLKDSISFGGSGIGSIRVVSVELI